jgi:flagellar motor switch protein FliN/FliY
MSEIEITDQSESDEVLSADALMDVKVRVWAEIGRTRMPLADAVTLAEGMLVDLDREHHEPIELYVNGMRMGSGRLVTVDGEWALTLDEICVGSDAVERLSTAG